jgi:hypothetical protein
VICRRVRHLNGKQLCRLCRDQAALFRTGRGQISAEEARRHGQQLSLIFPGRIVHELAGPRPAHAPAAPAGTYPVTHRQLVLFGLPRDLAAGRSRGALPGPRDPYFAAILEQAASDHAARHGWSKTRTNAARQGLRILAGLQDTPGTVISASQASCLIQIGIAVQPVLDILTASGLLREDRIPPIADWFARQVNGLPEPMTSELHTWFEVMRDGSASPPRRRPRSPGTIRIHLAAALPALHAWAATGHRSLREITRDDVIAALPASGTPRAATGRGLRSLFTVLKGRKVIFTNPAARIRTGKPETRDPLPLGQLPQLREALNSTGPPGAAISALAAYHGLRNQDIRGLLLTSIDGSRLRIGGRTILLAWPVRERLSAWLAYRASRWPATINPHLFINTSTAVRTTAVSSHYVRQAAGMAVQPIREDRILDEALATSGDVRQLIDLFGLSVAAALRYTTVTHPAPAPSPGSRTQAATISHEATRGLGSQSRPLQLSRTHRRCGE